MQTEMQIKGKIILMLSQLDIWADFTDHDNTFQLMGGAQSKEEMNKCE